MKNSEFVMGFFNRTITDAAHGNLFCINNKLYNYGTLLFEFVDTKVAVFNVTRYSNATSKIQNLIRRACEEFKVRTYEVSKLGYITQSYNLKQKAEEIYGKLN